MIADLATLALQLVLVSAVIHLIVLIAREEVSERAAAVCPGGVQKQVAGQRRTAALAVGRKRSYKRRQAGRVAA